MASKDSASRVAGILVGTTVPTLVSSLFVVGRIYSRRCLSGRWGVDDTLITTSWAVSLGLAVISCLFVVYGAGHHRDPSTPADMKATRRLIFSYRIVYQFVLGTTKLGICSFYLRIFQDKWNKRFIYALLAFVAGAALTIELTVVFSCKPVAGAWAWGVRNCLPAQPTSIGNTAANVFGDLAIMAFVFPKIVPLHIPRRQKIYIFSVVSLGFLVVIASIFRLMSIISFNNSPDIAWDEVSITTWTSTEVSTGLLCASAPCLKPLLLKLFPSLESALCSTISLARPCSHETKTIRFRRQSLQSHKPAFIPHLTKALTQKAKTGLEEVKLKTIKAKRHSRGTFAYAIRKRDDVFQESDWQDLSGGASVENWLGRTVDEEAVSRAAATVAQSDRSQEFANIGRKMSGAVSPTPSSG